MSKYIKRDKAIEAIAEHLMGEAVFEYSDASDNIEDWKEIGEAILESVPPAEVIPKGSDEASLAYAEGWKNGEEAERSRHKMNATGDLIERSEVLKQLWLNHKDVVYIDKNECARRIEAIPSARPKGEWIYHKNELSCVRWSKWECSACGERQEHKSNFCPNCGSDNREREGE